MQCTVGCAAVQCRVFGKNIAVVTLLKLEWHKISDFMNATDTLVLFCIHIRLFLFIYVYQCSAD